MLLGCGNQSQIRKDNRIHSVDEEIYSFNSTIENLFPAEPLLYYCYSNRTTYNCINIDSPSWCLISCMPSLFVVRRA